MGRPTSSESRSRPMRCRRRRSDGLDKVEELILGKAEELYRKREIEYPARVHDEHRDVDCCGRTRRRRSSSSSRGPTTATSSAGRSTHCGSWARPRHASSSKIACEKFVNERCAGEAHQRSARDPGQQGARGIGSRTRCTPSRRRTSSGSRATSARTRSAREVESVLRAEMLYFERTMLIETLDELWKNHLYAMDQLRDSIGLPRLQPAGSAHRVQGAKARRCSRP